MALNKVIYVDGETVITAENLNEIQDAIIALEESPVQGLTEDLKQAMLQIARKVAYIDDQGQTYYDDLYDALYPPKTVVSITAVFEQGTTVIYDNAALDSLKQYLQVTARYDDNTTAILSDSAYSLSGLLEAPSSTVTVLYNGVSTTFSVVVTARPTLSSITADYTQSGTVYDTDALDSLKADLVVTAHYSDSSTQIVPAADYTLSGTLTAGTSTITVSYSGMTTTFTVTVTEYVIPKDYEVGNLLYNWDFTQSLTDTVSGTVITLNGNASQGSEGLTIPDATSYASIPRGVVASGRIIEMDVANTNAKFGNVLGRFLLTNGSDRGVIYRYNTTWNVFTGGGWSDNTAFQENLSNKNAFSGTLFTVSFVNSNPKIYKDGVLMGTSTTANGSADFNNAASIGASQNAFYEATITAMRVYAGVN